MSRLQTLRMIACMLLMGVVAISLLSTFALFLLVFFADDYGRYYHLYLSVAV